MAFSGIIRPPALEPVPCGLLSVAQVFTNSDLGGDERWTRGSAFEYNSFPSSVSVVALDGRAVPVYSSPSGDSVLFEDLVPFYIEIDDVSSTLATTPEEVKERAIAQITASAQKQIELQLWDGITSILVGSGSPFLASGEQIDIVTSEPKPAAVALSLIEQSIANSPTGSQGVIHMTRDVASALGSRLDRKKDGKGRPYITTRLGTPVVVGSGYTGNGPVGSPDRIGTPSNKWMYATGDVQLLLGDIEFDSDMRDGSIILPSVNSIQTRALQAATVAFDPSIFYAAQVSLPDNA